MKFPSLCFGGSFTSGRILVFGTGEVPMMKFPSLVWRELYLRQESRIWHRTGLLSMKFPSASEQLYLNHRKAERKRKKLLEENFRRALA